MAIAREQVKNAANNNATSVAATFNSNVTAGSLIVACFWNYFGDSNTPTLACANSVDGSMTLIQHIDDNDTEDSTPDGGVGTSAMWYVANSGGGAMTVTVSGLSGSFCELCVLEYSGVATASALDVSAEFRYSRSSHGGASTGTFTSGNITTNVADTVLVGMCGTHNGSDIYTLDSGWGNEVVNAGASGGSLCTGDQILSATATKAFSGTLSSNVNWASCIVAAFKDAGGGAPSDPEGKLVGGKLMGGGLLMGGVLTRPMWRGGWQRRRNRLPWAMTPTFGSA